MNLARVAYAMCNLPVWLEMPSDFAHFHLFRINDPDMDIPISRKDFIFASIWRFKVLILLNR